MSIKATIKIGSNCNIQVEGESPVELIKSVSQFSQLPTKCGHCDSTNLSLSHRTAGNADEYDYLSLKCMDCGATGDIGQTKNPKGGIFFKHKPKDKNDVKGGFYKYWEQEGSSGSSGSYSNDNRDVAEGDEDDIPF